MDAPKLEALEGLISDVDAAGPPTPEQQQAAQAVMDADTAAREWGMVAFTIGGALAMLAPELRQVYTEDACLGWGRSAAAVADKYGWSGPANAPELGLIISTAGLAVPSYMAISLRLAQMRQAKAAQTRVTAPPDAEQAPAPYVPQQQGATDGS